MLLFEKLRQKMFEEIRVKVCDFILGDCDWCPVFISKHCDDNYGKEDENNDEFRNAENGDA